MRAAKSILSHTQLSQLETNLGSPTVWSPVKTNAQDECGAAQGVVWALGAGVESVQESKTGDPGRGRGRRKRGGHSSTCANCVPRQSCSDYQGNQLRCGAGGHRDPKQKCSSQDQGDI